MIFLLILYARSILRHFRRIRNSVARFFASLNFMTDAKLRNGPGYLKQNWESGYINYLANNALEEVSIKVHIQPKLLGNAG